MLQITVLAVGGLKESYFTAACGEYVKRLGAYCRVTVTEIQETRLPRDPSQGDIRRCLEAEGQAMLDKIPSRSHVTALCIEGKEASSGELAKRMGDLTQQYGHFVFLIGGSHGLSDQVKERADWKLSMSRLTFPHQLARVMLLEQLYRVCSINNGGKYHK